MDWPWFFRDFVFTPRLPCMAQSCPFDSARRSTRWTSNCAVRGRSMRCPFLHFLTPFLHMIRTWSKLPDVGTLSSHVGPGDEVKPWPWSAREQSGNGIKMIFVQPFCSTSSTFILHFDPCRTSKQVWQRKHTMYFLSPFLGEQNLQGSTNRDASPRCWQQSFALAPGNISKQEPKSHPRGPFLLHSSCGTCTRMRNTAVKDCKWIGASVEITFPFEAGKFKGVLSDVSTLADWVLMISGRPMASLSLQTLSLLSQAHALRHR